MRIIGIDLGTTNSLVSVWENGKSVPIPNAFGEYLTPSVVSVNEAGDMIFVGQIASERLISHPHLTASIFKRFMGTRQRYELGNRVFLPEELSAFVLKRLKEDAENYLGGPVEEAVISVPAYFNDMARNATKRAGKIAGLRVERIINEPSAAALTYQNNNPQEDAMILVFDLGGGTLDVSLVECFDNVLNILAVSGDNRLGGHDFDKVLAELFCEEKGITFKSLNKETQAVLLKSGRQCKHELTKTDKATMYVSCEKLTGDIEVTRERLIQASAGIFQRMEKPIRAALSDGGIKASELTHIVLVGGSCKMPVVKQYLHYLLKREDIDVVDPDYMIVRGAGIYAGIKERKEDIKDMLLTDICPFSLGIATYNESEPGKDIMSVIIERNASLPTSREEGFHTVHDFQKVMKLKIYQGEQYYSGENLKLGELSVQIPPEREGKVSVNVRFTYDINGVLEVEACVPKTGKKEKLVIVNKEMQLTQEELERKLRDFAHIKIHPREKETNQLLLSRGEQLYARATGELRNDLKERLGFFEHLLMQQDEYQIIKWRKFIEGYFEQVEWYLGATTPGGEMNHYTKNWHERNPKTSVIENFEEWRKKNGHDPS